MNAPEHSPGISRDPALNRFNKRNLFPEQVARATAFLRKSGLPDLGKESEHDLISKQRITSIEKLPIINLSPLSSMYEWAIDKINYFLSDELLDKFLDVVDDAPEEEVKNILGMLIVQQRVTQEAIAESWNSLFHAVGKQYNHLSQSEQTRDQVREHTELAWVLNLIPSFPQEAIKSINAYLLANRPALPIAYTNALNNCEAIIRTRYLSHWRPRELFTELGVRNFELLIAFLYEKQGYQANFPEYPENEYADLIATRLINYQQTVCLIRCKIEERSVGIAETRQLLARIQTTKSAKGILITTSYFSPEARKLAANEQIIDLVDGERLTKMLNDYLGIYWRSKVDSYISEQRSRYVQYR